MKGTRLKGDVKELINNFRGNNHNIPRVRCRGAQRGAILGFGNIWKLGKFRNFIMFCEAMPIYLTQMLLSMVISRVTRVYVHESSMVQYKRWKYIMYLYCVPQSHHESNHLVCCSLTVRNIEGTMARSVRFNDCKQKFICKDHPYTTRKSTENL